MSMIARTKSPEINKSMPMSILSHRLAEISPSATIDMTSRAQALKAQGHNVISLSAGEPDFDTPAHIAAAGIEAIQSGKTRYTAPDGLPELKSAIVEKFRRDNALNYTVDQITVGAGGKHVLYNALVATLNPGDEVIFAAPYWVSYPDMVRLCGGVPVPVATRASDGYRLLAEDLARAITSRTKWVILNSPSNPSGATLGAAELGQIADVLRANPHVWTLCDDIYEHLIYDGAVFSTLGQVAPDLQDRILTMNGVSKGYAMTGWRIGFAGGPKELIAAMRKVQSQSTSNPCTISQVASIAALTGPQDALESNKARFCARRDLVTDHLNAIGGITCPKPQGAFYVYPDIGGLLGRRSAGGSTIENDRDFAMAFLQECHVAAVFGAAFGLSPNIRISYAMDEASLATACDRLAAFCEGLT